MNLKFLKAAIIGAAFTISSVANAGIIFSDNFDPISTANWTISNGGVFGDGITEFYDGNALYFNGSGSRFAHTSGFDLTQGESVSFYFRQGKSPSTSYFENTDGLSEAMDFSYSVDGTNYTTIFTFNPSNNNYNGSWQQFSFDINGAMLSSSTSFKWQQRDNSGSSYDHWAIDNVAITSAASAQVPEPTSLAILALGILGFTARRFKK